MSVRHALCLFLAACTIVSLVLANGSYASASTSNVIGTTADAIGPGAKIRIQIADFDLNINPQRTDEFEGDDTGDGMVVFRTDRSEAGQASPDLEETGPNTGVFKFEIQLVPIEGGDDGQPIPVRGGSDPRIGVLPGDLLMIRYEDNRNAEGRSEVLSTTVEVKSWDPQFTQDKESYDVNDRVTVTIVDPDANLDPDIADSLTGIRVFSDSDAVGQTYSALETGENSGEFRLSFQLADEARGGAVMVRDGDTVTIVYTDEFPADYAARLEETDNPDKEFHYTFIVGEIAGLDATTPSQPKVRDFTGNELTQIEAGQQVALSTEIENNRARALPFVAIMEVRDSEDRTIYLQWQAGTLNPDAVTGIGLFWTPEAAGEYEVRVLVLDRIVDSPGILSAVVTSQVTVD
jgi:hypothetical protein